MPQPILLPLFYCAPAAYYAQALRAGALILEQHETYQKRSFRNRCEIANAHGRQTLSVPLVQGKHEQMPIDAVQIDAESRWAIQHWRSIQTAYGNAPFFEHYAERLIGFWEKPWTNLWAMNLEFLRLSLRMLRVEIAIGFSDSYQRPAPSDRLDLRTSFPLKSPAHLNPPSYPQVFSDRQNFLPNLSVLDLIFCLGPQAASYLRTWPSLETENPTHE